MHLFILLSGIFITSFVLGLSGAMAPGPLLVFTISESSRRGFITGPLLVVGHGILELVLIVLIVVGIGRFLKHDLVIGATGVCGAVLLLWMAYAIFKNLPASSTSVKQRISVKHNPVLYGFIMSISNPYWTIWWITIGLGYIMYALKFGAIGVAVFFTGHILSDLLWYSMVSFGFSQGKRFISDRIYKIMLCGCALILAGFGLWFAYTGVTSLTKFYI